MDGQEQGEVSGGRIQLAGISQEGELLTTL